MEDSKYQQFIEGFSKIPKITISEIDLSILDLSNSEYIDLINRTEDGPNLSIDSNGLTIKLKSPAYFKELNILLPETEKSKDLVVSFRSIFGYPGLINAKFIFEEQSDIISFNIDSLVSEIVIKHKKWLFIVGDQQPVRKIILKGILSNEFLNLTESIKNILSFQDNFLKELEKEKLNLESRISIISKQEVEFQNKVTKTEKALADKEAVLQNNTVESELRLKTIQAEIKVKNTELVELKSQLDKLKENQSTISIEVENAKIQLKELKVKESESITNHKEKTEQIKELEILVSKEKAELIRLSQDKSLFTEDIKGHFKEGYKQIRLYTGILLLPIISAILMGIGIYNNSDKVTNLLIDNPDIGIVSLLSSRIPYSTISLALIAFFSTISTILLNRMITIHKSRLRFSEIGILTKDASDSFLSGQTLTESQRQEFRLGMRMKLLREYISGKFDNETKDEDLINFLQLKKKAKLNETDKVQ